MTSIPRPLSNCVRAGCRQPASIRGLCRDHAKHEAAQRLKELHDKRDKHERRVRYGAAWQRQRKRILDRDGHACVYCGTSTRLEVHHIDDTPHPLDAQLVTLCYRHHRAIEAEVKRGKVGKIGQAVAQWINASKVNQ